MPRERGDRSRFGVTPAAPVSLALQIDPHSATCSLLDTILLRAVYLFYSTGPAAGAMEVSAGAGIVCGFGEGP